MDYYTKRDSSIDWKEQIMQLGYACKWYVEQDRVPNKCVKAFLIALSQRKSLSEEEENLNKCLIYKKIPEGKMEEMSDLGELIYLLCLQYKEISTYKDPLIEFQKANKI